MHADLATVLIVLQLIYLEGILSIDNAAVLGAMVAQLPDTPIPWPHALRRIGKPVGRIMGTQQTAALRIGLPGAYIGRILMLFIAAWVIRNQWLLLVGALYLVKLAADYLGETTEEEAAAAADGTTYRRLQRSFWSVAGAVVLVDLAFSLDNVVAAVALSRQFWIVVIGVLLGITTMRFAAQIFVYLIKRYPIIEAAAYLLVLNIGIELLLEDFAGVHFSDVTKFGISLGTLVLTLIYGRSHVLRRIGRRFRWLKRVFAFISLLFLYLLKPLVWLLQGASGVLRPLAMMLSSRFRARDITRPRRA